MRTVLLCLILLALPACTATQRAAAPPRDPRALTVYSGASGDAVAWDALVSAASESDHIIVGENHGHPLGLAFASALFGDLLPRTDHAALSMEFFERDEQSDLDDYLGGLVDEKTFREQTRRTRGNYPPGHRDMVEAAKAADRPVIAANSPRQYAKAARTDSYDRLLKLTAEQQRLFRIPDAVPTGRYADDFRKIMSRAPEDHSEPPADPEARAKAQAQAEAKAKEDAQRVESFFRAQSLWDWTMADSLARAAAAGNRPILHVVGRFHSDHRGGLVQALEKLRPGDRIITVSVVDHWSETLREEDRGRADYVVYVGPSSTRAAAASR